MWQQADEHYWQPRRQCPALPALPAWMPPLASPAAGSPTAVTTVAACLPSYRVCMCMLCVENSKTQHANLTYRVAAVRCCYVNVNYCQGSNLSLVWRPLDTWYHHHLDIHCPPTAARHSRFFQSPCFAQAAGRPLQSCQGRKCARDV